MRATSKAIMALAVLAMAFVGATLVMESDDSDAAIEINVGQSYTDLQIVIGGSVTYGSVPGCTLSTKVITGVYFIVLNGTPTTAGTYTIQSDAGRTAVVQVNAAETNYEVTITPNNSSYGSVSLSSITVPSNTSFSTSGNTLSIGGHTITATPASNTSQYTYSFNGWSPSSGSVNSSNTTITANFSRTAVTPSTYSVTIYKGNWDSFKLLSDGTTYTSSSHTYSIAPGTSIDVDWYGAASSTINYTNYSKTTSYTNHCFNMVTSSSYPGGGSDSVTINSSGSYYPADRMESTDTYTYNYTIKYNANGGSGAPIDTTTTSTSSSYSSTTSKSITLSSVTPTRSGYMFQGWADSSTATTPTYSAGQSYTFVYGIKTIYAVWASASNQGTWQDANGNTITTLSIAKGGSSTVYMIPSQNAMSTAVAPGSSNNSVASVSATYVNQAKIKVDISALAVGTSNITVGYYTTVTEDYLTSSQLAVTVTAPMYDIYLDVRNLNGATLKYNGTTVTTSQSYSVAEGTSITLAVSNIPSNYRFSHWYIVYEDSEVEDTGVFTPEINDTITENMVFHPYVVQIAQHTVQISMSSQYTGCTVSINAGSYGNYTLTTADNTRTLTVNEGTSITLQANPPATGYLFLAWMNTPSGNRADNPFTFTVNDDATIQAVFNQVYRANLHFNANGGTGAPTSLSYVSSTTADHTFTIPNTEPTRANYAFMGWAESASASRATYQPNDTITVAYNESKTLYAVWAPLTGAGTWQDANGNTITSLNITKGTSSTVYMIPSQNAMSTAVAPGSSNNSVASVSATYVNQAKIKVDISALAVGTSNITVGYYTTVTEDYLTSSQLAVTVALPMYDIYLDVRDLNGATLKYNGTTVTTSQSYQVAEGTSVTLSVTDIPDSYRFDHWYIVYEDSEVEDTGVFTPEINDTITENMVFHPYVVQVVQYNVTLEVSQYYGDSSVTATGPGMDTVTVGAGETRTFKVVNGTPVTFTASAADTYQFDRWQVIPSGNSAVNPLVLVIEGDVIVRPMFSDTPIDLPDVWWNNGYMNGGANIVFNYGDSMSIYNHTMYIPLYAYDGIKKESPGVNDFYKTRYTLRIDLQFPRTTATFTVYEGSAPIGDPTTVVFGTWPQFALDIDAQTSMVKFTGIGKVAFNDFSFLNYSPIYETVAFDFSSITKNNAFNRIYHDDTGTASDHISFQVMGTRTYLDTYGFVMIDPKLNIYNQFPEYNDLRLNLYSFALYGDSLTINGHTMQMDGSKMDIYVTKNKVPIKEVQEHQRYIGRDPQTGESMFETYYTEVIMGYEEYYDIASPTDADAVNLKLTLTNVYITWENINRTDQDNPRECYLTFVDDGITVRMGTFSQGDLTISGEGMWFFTTGLWEPYQDTKKTYTMDWNSLFNISAEGFLLILIGAAIGLTVLASVAFGYRLETLDWLVVIGGVILAYFLMGVI